MPSMRLSLRWTTAQASRDINAYILVGAHEYIRDTIARLIRKVCISEVCAHIKFACMNIRTHICQLCLQRYTIVSGTTFYVNRGSSLLEPVKCSIDVIDSLKFVLVIFFVNQIISHCRVIYFVQIALSSRRASLSLVFHVSTDYQHLLLLGLGTSLADKFLMLDHLGR